MACLKPRSLPRQQLAWSELHIQPAPATRTERVDYFGNLLCFFTVQEPHKELVVEARSEVTMDGHATPWPQQSLAWEEVARSLPGDQSPAGLEAYQFGFESPRIRMRPEFAAYALQSFTPGRPIRGGASGSDRAHPQGFSLRFEGDQRPDAHRRGVSQTAWRVPGFRALANRLPALAESRGSLCKWISSNLSASRTTETGGRRCIPRVGVRLLSGNRLADVDPTNNVVPSNGHVTLAWGRDYGDVSPLHGLILGGELIR